MLRRIFLLAVLISLTAVLLLRIFQPQWHSIRPSIRSGDTKGTSHNDAPTLENGDEVNPFAWENGKEKGQFKEPKVDAKSPYPLGETKPAGSNYTRTLVIPKLQAEDTSWIQTELGDMLASGLLDTAIYVMDDRTAPLHPIQNKGHEVMAYLSYIIDFYSNLPDVSIFMHAHRFAYHNNLILDKDSALTVRHLSPERVTREGYMNLRCHWDPGCPDWMRPQQVDFQSDKREQQVLASTWRELFPKEPLPEILAQPCCAQFAVSRARIQAIPRARFLRLREWLVRTDLDDFLSGRIFEYTWQYIFTASPFHCPSMSACYCDGYGICFGDAERFDYYFELEFYRKKYEDELAAWNARALQVKVAHEKAEDGRLRGQEMLEVPEVGRDVWLRKEIASIERDMETRKMQAFERGKDAQQRAKEAGREWKDGDGF